VKFNKIKLRKTTPGVDNFLPSETAETYMLFSNYRSKNKLLVFIPSYNWTCDELILKVFHKQLKCCDQNIFSTKLCGYLLLHWMKSSSLTIYSIFLPSVILLGMMNNFTEPCFFHCALPWNQLSFCMHILNLFWVTSNLKQSKLEVKLWY